MEIAIQTRVLYNNQIRTIDRFLGNIQTWPQTGFLCSIDPKFVRKFLFNILLFARNSNTNRVSSSNFPLWEDQGNHDQNVSCEEGAFFSLIVIQCTSNHNRHRCSFKLIGSALCFPVSTVALSLYKIWIWSSTSHLNLATLPTLILIDELLTPDSSQY